MNKTLTGIGVLLLLIAIAMVAYILLSRISPRSPVTGAATSAKDATYTIDGQQVTLKNGFFAVPASPGSAGGVTTTYFGNDVSVDLNNDGRMDTVFLLTQDTGGSGTFYYAVAALNTPTGYVGSQGLFLGDRIAPQSTELSANNTVVINYADRNPGESFAVAPSVGKSIVLKFNPATMQFGEVAQHFEGEADPSTMTLDMHTWNWVQTTYSNDATVTPRTQKFTLTFKSDNTFSATTDCNGVSGKYTATGSVLTFGNMASTLMFCEGSQEQGFTRALGEVQGYLFTAKGELVLKLKRDSGTMTFR